LGYNGALLLMFAHGISIALLFYLANALRQRTGTLDLSSLGGLARPLPFMGLAFGMAAMASIGLPGFANFAGEIQIFFGGFQDFSGKFTRLQWAVVLALWGVVLSAVYMLRAYRSAFKGEQPQRLSLTGTEMSAAERLPVFILLAALLIVGFFPGTLLNLAKEAIARLAH
jgi:NADH-quinone oxidoreductase subunit M